MKPSKILIITAILLISLGQMPIVLADDFVPAEESQNSSNQFILDADNSGGNIVLQFGATLAESLTWNSASSLFDLSDDLTLAGGLTTTGGANSLNNNSNFATDINTGTSTGAVSIGGGSGTIAIDSTSWDISTAGVGSGFTGFTTTGAVSLGNNTGTITFDGTNFDLTSAGAVTLTGNLTLSGDANEGLSGGGLTSCNASNQSLQWNSTTNKFECTTAGNDTAVFIDTTPAAMADNNTTELFNDTTKPNIITESINSTVLVTVNVHESAASGTDNEYDAMTIARTTNGVNPVCGTSPNIATFVGFSTDAAAWSASTTLIDAPGVAGTIKYTVCSSSESVGGPVNNAPNDITVSLIQMGD